MMTDPSAGMALYHGLQSNHGWQVEIYLCGARGNATCRILRKELKEQPAPRAALLLEVCQADPGKPVTGGVGSRPPIRRGGLLSAESE
jgi:hypothetical protein